MELISGLVHQLSWHLLGTAEWPEEFTADEEGMLCDLTGIYLGFGVFHANAAFEYSATADFERQGWSSQRQGFLSETSMVFATAIFLRLSGTSEADALKHLKPHLSKQLRKALKQVDASPEQLNRLRSAEPPRLELV